MICPYCDAPAIWCSNEIVYGKPCGKSFMIWLCHRCDAYVGCHKNTKAPLGTLANKELRIWRMNAHKVIDPLWKSGKMKRKAVYAMLEKLFGREIHVGESDVDTCKEIIKRMR